MASSNDIIATLTNSSQSLTRDDDDDDDECAICLEPHKDPVHLPPPCSCQRIFCRACITVSLQTNHKCPFCRKPMYEREDEARYATIIEVLEAELTVLRAENAVRRAEIAVQRALIRAEIEAIEEEMDLIRWKIKILELCSRLVLLLVVWVFMAAFV